MRKIMGQIILLILAVLTACGVGDVFRGDPDITGYVTSKSKSGTAITVASKEAENLSNDGGRSEFYDKTSLSNSPENIHVGESVKVWTDGAIAESYPAKGKIAKIKVMESSLREGASMTEAEALKEAIDNDGDLAVRSITFDQDVQVWTVEFIDIHDDEVWSVTVEE